ncbi:MAG: hypothetical protein WA063_06790 [Minisyncoccia bacterium]
MDMKIKLNKINFRNILNKTLERRGLFLIIIFGSLLIFNFNVIYQDIYIKLNCLDSSEALKVFDGKRETIIIRKITDNLKLREERIQNELKKEHKNIFIYNLSSGSSGQIGSAEPADSLGNISENVLETVDNGSANIPESANGENYPELSN